jgi:hypothetical protein
MNCCCYCYYYCFSFAAQEISFAVAAESLPQEMAHQAPWLGECQVISPPQVSFSSSLSTSRLHNTSKDDDENENENEEKRSSTPSSTPPFLGSRDGEKALAKAAAATAAAARKKILIVQHQQDQQDQQREQRRAVSMPRPSTPTTSKDRLTATKAYNHYQQQQQQQEEEKEDSVRTNGGSAGARLQQRLLRENGNNGNNNNGDDSGNSRESLSVDRARGEAATAAGRRRRLADETPFNSDAPSAMRQPFFKKRLGKGSGSNLAAASKRVVAAAPKRGEHRLHHPDQGEGCEVDGDNGKEGQVRVSFDSEGYGENERDVALLSVSVLVFKPSAAAAAAAAATTAAAASGDEETDSVNFLELERIQDELLRATQNLQKRVSLQFCL